MYIQVVNTHRHGHLLLGMLMGYRNGPATPPNAGAGTLRSSSTASKQHFTSDSCAAMVLALEFDRTLASSSLYSHVLVGLTRKYEQKRSVRC